MEILSAAYTNVRSRFVKRVGIGAAAVVLAGAAGSLFASPARAQLGTAKAAIIGVKSLSFDPKKVTVKPNTPINFVWRQNVAHNIVFEGKNAPKSKTQNKGTWSMKASATSGTYKYKCTLHPGMAGQIVVQ